MHVDGGAGVGGGGERRRRRAEREGFAEPAHATRQISPKVCLEILEQSADVLRRCRERAAHESVQIPAR